MNRLDDLHPNQQRWAQLQADYALLRMKLLPHDRRRALKTSAAYASCLLVLADQLPRWVIYFQQMEGTSHRYTRRQRQHVKRAVLELMDCLEDLAQEGPVEIAKLGKTPS